MKILLKIVLSLAIIVNVVSNTYSQKIRTKSENIKYTRLPLISLPDHVKTYCNVFSPYDSDMKTITDNYKNYMRMNGYEITDIANADIILELKIGPFTLESKKIRNDMIPLYNGEGEKTGTRVVYQYSLEFTCPAKFIISERNGQVILDSLIYSLSSPIYDYWGEENYLSESSLAENWIFYEKSVLDNKKKSIVSNVIEQINQFLNDFSSQEVIDNVFFYSYKTTKKENYLDYDQAATSALNALSDLNYPEKIKNASDTLMKCINLWKNKSKNLNPLDENEEKLYRGVYYNMAVAYLWLNEFDLASSNLEKSIITFFADVMNSELREVIKDRRIRYERSFK